MKKICYTLLLFSAACRHEPQIMSEEKMVHWFIAMYLSDARLERSGLPYERLDTLAQLRKNIILQQMNVTDSLLSRSYQYYLENPKKMERIYERVVDSLSLQEQQMRLGKPSIAP